MVAASAVSYSSVNQYDGNRSIMWRHLNSCSSCDSGNNSFRRHSNMRTCRHHHQHYHHTRRPAIRQNKRCTFATTTTTILSSACANSSNNSTSRHHPSSSTSLAQSRQQSDHHQQEFESNPHPLCQSQSSNSSNTSSIRIIDWTPSYIPFCSSHLVGSPSIQKCVPCPVCYSDLITLYSFRLPLSLLGFIGLFSPRIFCFC